MDINAMFSPLLSGEADCQEEGRLVISCDRSEYADVRENVFTVWWYVDESELECSGFEEENTILCVAGILESRDDDDDDVRKTYTTFPDEIPESCPAAAAALHLVEKYLEENGFRKKKDAK